MLLAATAAAAATTTTTSTSVTPSSMSTPPPLLAPSSELQDGAADLIDAHGHGQRLGHGEPLSLTVHVRRKHDGAAATFLRVVLELVETAVYPA